MSQSNRNQSSSSSSQQAELRRPSSQEMRDAWHKAAEEARKVMTRRDSTGFEGEQTGAADNYLGHPRDAPKAPKSGDQKGGSSKGGSSSHSLAKQMEHEERYGSGRRAKIYGFAVAAEGRRR
ncbi:hypothetical protein JCM10296v2_002551 [Rhodotorula toruloides]